MERQNILVCIIFLTFLLLFLPNSNGYYVPEDQSLDSLRRLPEEFPFDCEFDLIISLLFPGYECLGLLDNLCIDQTNINLDSIKSRMSPEEKALFSDSIKHFENAEDFLEDAKIKRSDLIFFLSEQTLRICTYTYMYTSLSPFIQSCKIESVIYNSRAIEIADDYRRALEETTKGMNSAFEILRTTSDKLYYIGGGKENYTGEAAIVYNDVRDFIRLSKAGIIGDTGSKRWTKISKAAWKINEEYDEKGIKNCEAMNIINNILTTPESSNFLQIIYFYNQVNNAISNTKNDYSEVKARVSSLLDDGKNEYNEMIKEDYDEIDAEHIWVITSSEAEETTMTELEALPVPYSSVKEIEHLIYGSGFEGGAQSFYKDSISIYKNGFEFYVVNAIEKLNDAENLLDRAGIKINYIKSYVDSLLERSTNIATVKKREIEDLISRYEFEGRLSAGLYSGAIDEKNSGDNCLLFIKTKTIGKQVVEYSNAIKHYQMAYLLLTDKKKYILNLKTGSSGGISQLEGIINKAKIDEINVDSEELILADSKALIEITDNETILSDISKSCEDAMESIYNKAKIKYSYLNEKRLEIIDKIKLLEFIPFSKASKYEKDVSIFEDYLENGSFLPEKAIGRYKIIDSEYNDIIEDVTLKITTAFSNYLSDNYKVTEILPNSIFVDEDVEILTRIEIENDLVVGTTENFVLRVSGVKIDQNSIATTPPNIDIAAYSNGIDILFNGGIEPKKVYTITILSNSTIAEESSLIKKMLYLSENELVERYDLSIDVDKNINNLIYKLDAGDYADICNSYLNGIEIQTINELFDDNQIFSVYLGKIKSGKLSFYVKCRTFNPISIYKSNEIITIGNESDIIEYYLNIKSNIGQLEDVRVSTIVPSNTVDGSARAFNLDGNPPKLFSFKEYGADYLLSWEIPILTNDYQIFKIYYETVDISEYLRSFRDKLIDQSNDVGVDISDYITRANEAIGKNDHNKALTKLQRAEEIIDSARNLKIEKEALGERLTSITNLFENATENLENLTAIGFSDVALELNKRFGEFNNKKEEAIISLEKNMTSDAAKAIKEMERLINAGTIDNALEKEAKNVFKDFSKLKGEFFTLSNVFNLSSEISEIERDEGKVINYSNLISEKKYFEAGSILKELRRDLNILKEKKDNKTDSLLSLVNEEIIDIKNIKDYWKTKKKEIIRMLEIDPENPGERLSINESETLMEEIDKIITGLDSFYNEFKSASLEEAVNGISKIKSTELSINKFNETKNDLEELEDKSKINAENTYYLSRSLLEEFSKKVTSSEDKENLSFLSGYLNKAKEAYDSEKYLNSMVYSDYIKKKVGEINLVEDFAINIDLVTIMGLLFVLVITAIIVTLIKKEKPKPPIVLEKIE